MAATTSSQRTVEFYLSSLWSWLPEGCKRILDALESCDLRQASIVWDEKCDWFKIRCLEEDKDYIMNEYLKAQSEMENELKEKDVIRSDGSLVPNVKNDLIEILRPRASVPGELHDPEVTARETKRADTPSSNGHGRIERSIERQAVSQNAAYPF